MQTHAHSHLSVLQAHVQAVRRLMHTNTLLCPATWGVCISVQA